MSRVNEYKALLYRLLLAYVFYFVARVLFYAFNASLIPVAGVFEFLKLSVYGLAFDTTAILYLNSLFILLSLLPLWINASKTFQKVLFYVYFTTNLIGYATNFIDFIYYKFIFSRTTTAVLGSLENESNKFLLLLQFITDYWFVLLVFILVAALWIFAYKKVTIQETKNEKILLYILVSVLVICIAIPLCIGGVRGDFKHSTRPINLVDANRHIKNPIHADIVLNSPFSIIRTIGKSSFKKPNFVSESTIQKIYNPIKQYPKDSIRFDQPNVVIFIIESYGREYLGAFNKHRDIKDYVGYTPFLDSLAAHSMVYSNAFSNGRKSIHGMSSILAGIPSFEVAFTSSPYAKQPIQSVVSGFNEMGYDTSFYHGAPNGSMGFLGFGNILGFDNYVGLTEYDAAFKDNDDFDGLWGIWDDPFLQYMKTDLDTKKTPFMATVFTVTSHSPYVIPEKYKGVFPEGHLPMHKCVGYTDFAIRNFMNAAKKEAWFDNTLFVFTADHGNQTYYDFFKESINRYTVPIMYYHPSEPDFLVGESAEITQQIDIYPTLMGLTGYEKPFRSWGRSVLHDTIVEPYVINHTEKVYQYARGDYNCVFDGATTLGFYDIADTALKKNLINEKNTEMEAVEIGCKAFIQDYMTRIIDRKLSVD